MHSYVHQWACQLHYNPRMKKGMGLTDGENVERLWSALRRLIGVCRHSAVRCIQLRGVMRLIQFSKANRRIWMIDRSLQIVAVDRRRELGGWSTRKLKQGVQKQKNEARRVLDANAIPMSVISQQWDLQKKEQLSLRARTSFSFYSMFKYLKSDQRRRP